MGQSSSAPTRNQARDNPRKQDQQAPSMKRDQQHAADDDSAAAPGSPKDGELSSGGAQGVRRRRSTAGAPRDFKRQRPRSLETDPLSANVSPVSSSRSSFDTAPSQVSTPSNSNEQRFASESASRHSSRSSRSGRASLRRLRNRVRSVFASQDDTASEALQQGSQIPAGFVNTAVPGTPGILENIAADTDISRPSSVTAGASLPHALSSTSTPPPLPETPAPAFTERSEDATAGNGTSTVRPSDESGPSHADTSSLQDDGAVNGSQGQSRPIGPMTREELTQVETLSRVLLTAASLTAVRLVGSPFSSGELYAGSNETNALRRRAQAEIEARRAQRERDERERLAGVNASSGEATASSIGHDTHTADTEFSANRGNAERPPDAQDTPEELTFATFLEQLRTGRHSEELANAMFGTPEANFFRVFRFHADAEGRIPILMMGIRSAQREGQARDDDRERLFEPWRVSSQEERGFASDRNDASHSNDFDVSEPNLGYDFADSNLVFNHENSDDELDDVNESDDSDPVFDDEGDEMPGRNPFRPDHERADESARLLNSIISGFASTEPSQAESSDDSWMRPPVSRASRAGSEQGERDTQRQQLSWVIYVIGGAYSSTHPFFFAPSLMTDNPTHEDLLIAEELLGPAKRPVASQNDLDSAGGMFTIGKGSDMLNDRCPVCLMDYQEDETCRKLSCQHMFHRDCVDNWLTRSHNTCPMCRTTGVPSNNSSRPGFAAA